VPPSPPPRPPLPTYPHNVDEVLHLEGLAERALAAAVSRGVAQRREQQTQSARVKAQLDTARNGYACVPVSSARPHRAPRGLVGKAVGNVFGNHPAPRQHQWQDHNPRRACAGACAGSTAEVRRAAAQPVDLAAVVYEVDGLWHGGGSGISAPVHPGSATQLQGENMAPLAFAARARTETREEANASALGRQRLRSEVLSSVLAAGAARTVKEALALARAGGPLAPPLLPVRLSIHGKGGGGAAPPPRAVRCAKRTIARPVQTASERQQRQVRYSSSRAMTSGRSSPTAATQQPDSMPGDHSVEEPGTLGFEPPAVLRVTARATSLSPTCGAAASDTDRPSSLWPVAAVDAL
jgi:hypothetical protein